MILKQNISSKLPKTISQKKKKKKKKLSKLYTKQIKRKKK